MFKELSARTASLIFCFFVLSSSTFADGIPAWLLQTTSLPTPIFEIKNVPAIVLRNEEIVTVGSDGTVIRTVRQAVRILVREGRREAIARIVYQTDSDKVRDINAWLIRKTGPGKEYGKKETVDLALVDNDLYNEARVRLIDASDDAEAGDIFGFETVIEERSIFSQFVFRFQDDIPALFSKFTLNLPAGWKAESVTMNRPKIEPVISGSTYTWELRDLSPIKPEPASPSWSSLAPRIAVSFFPVDATATQIRTFANWNDVARWMSEIEDPQMTVDDALAAKTQEITAGGKTEIEKIAAISRYVQQIQYISIQVGAGMGGGYRPRSATEVFAKSYGDCKDKANLMRAMLSILKIQSFMVSITSGDRTYVRSEWASPHQFNHCIIAIKISDATNVNSVVIHPKLGRLLIFDPTDSYTPLGDLPDHQQGSLALIDHKDTYALTEMPTLPAETNRLERNIEVELSPAGGITGVLSQKTLGQSARDSRAQMKNLSAQDYNRVIESWISRGASGAKTTKISPVDGHQEGKFNLDVSFSASSYAQIMQDRLMVFKPAIVGRLEQLYFNDDQRMHPYLIESSSYSEAVKIKLPEGFIVDEMPDPTKLYAPFGQYDAKYEVSGNYLVFSRSLKLHRSTITADKYDTVRKFFGSVHAAEQAPVVLLRK